MVAPTLEMTNVVYYSMHKLNIRQINLACNITYGVFKSGDKVFIKSLHEGDTHLLIAEGTILPEQYVYTKGKFVKIMGKALQFRYTGVAKSLKALTDTACCTACDVRIYEHDECVFDGQYWQQMGEVNSMKLLYILNT